LIALVGVAATGGALAVDLGRYQSFLFLLGSFFIPLFGVLAADFLSGAERQVAVRWSGLVAWLAGFAAYQWIQPTGPAWWTEFAGGAPGAGQFTGGASLPSFALAFALYAGLRYARAPLGRRRARFAGSR
jgi:purine-cytosine permease-like protein